MQLSFRIFFQNPVLLKVDFTCENNGFPYLQRIVKFARNCRAGVNFLPSPFWVCSSLLPSHQSFFGFLRPNAKFEFSKSHFTPHFGDFSFKLNESSRQSLKVCHFGSVLTQNLNGLKIGQFIDSIGLFGASSLLLNSPSCILFWPLIAVSLPP